MNVLTSLLQTTIRLGVTHEGGWAPVGAGFLVAEQSLVWLVTTTPVLDRAGGASLGVWVRRTLEGGLLPLSQVLKSAELNWIHNGRGLAACVFPINSAFEVRALPRHQQAHSGTLTPLMRLRSVVYAYGVDGLEVPGADPLLIPGEFAGLSTDRERIYTTIPYLPLCEGSPVVVFSGSEHQLELRLAGVMGRPLRSPEGAGAGSLPPALERFSEVTPVDSLGSLLDSPAAKSQRDAYQRLAEEAQQLKQDALTSADAPGQAVQATPSAESASGA